MQANIAFDLSNFVGKLSSQGSVQDRKREKQK